jgi:hypothetical protein
MEGEKGDILSQFHQQIEDLKHYADHREFLRLEVWFEEKEG